MKSGVPFLPLAAAFALALAAPAAAEAPVKPSDVQSGAYVVEPGHTQVAFSVLHFGFNSYFGLFSNVSGALTLNAKNPSESKLEVTIPVASVQTTSDKLTGELKGDQWFDAAKYPNASFVSTSVKPTGDNEAVVAGNLTIRGVTRPETLKVRFVGAGVNPMSKKYTTGFEATGVIKRSDYGVKTYVPYVSDEVQLRLTGAFEKQD